MEKDEDTYRALKEMAEDIHLVSRNDNDEVIGIEYYANFSVLTHAELTELEALWQRKVTTCVKERWASQWMVIQVCLFVILANYIAWLSGGIAGAVSSVIGLMAMIAMIEDKRVEYAKRNLQDARVVHQKLCFFLEKSAA